MKKILSLVLSVIITTFVFTACQKDDVTETDSTTTETTITEKIDETSAETTVTDETETQVTEIEVVGETEVTTAKTAITEKPEETTKKVVADGILSSFESKDINGKKVDASVFRGKKLTMINIWATFCGPCINEMPDLGKINREYADKGFQIIGIPVDVTDYYGNIDENQISLAKEIIDETGADYLHIMPSASLNSAKLSQVTSVPETIFVDENGCQVGESYIGSRSEAEWLAIIDKLMENM